MATSVRPYISVAKYSRDDAVAGLDALYAEVLSANWADYLYLVFNVPFWELEYEKVQTHVQPYLHEGEVGDKFHKLQELMDVLYQCEDVRDHINELCEISTRSSGIMGTGFLAGKPVDNMDENAKACAAAYDTLLTKHPAFKPKIEQTAGHGLAVLRAKHKFRFSSVYRYFY